MGSLADVSSLHLSVLVGARWILLLLLGSRGRLLIGIWLGAGVDHGAAVMGCYVGGLDGRWW